MKWLLIRGLGRQAQHWGDFPQALEAAGLGPVVATPNFPGLGGISVEARGNSSSQKKLMIDSLRAQVPASARGGPLALMGISLGGMCALQWAQLYPREVASIVLINSSVPQLSPWYKRMRPMAIYALAKWLLQQDLAQREREILLFTTALAEISDQLVQDRARIARDNPIPLSALVRQIEFALKMQSPHHLKQPMLVLSGAADRLCHPDCSRAIARHYRSQILVHPQAGHDLPLDDPQWVINSVQKWNSLGPIGTSDIKALE